MKNEKNNIILKQFIGLKIKEIQFNKDKDKVFICFENGKSLGIWDVDGTCCNSRYMTSDDDFSSVVGDIFCGIEEKEGKCEYNENACDEEVEQETMFIEIKTNKNFITIVNHNDHSGAYGGFEVNVEIV